MDPLVDPLTAEQVAGRLGVHVKTVRRWMRAGVACGVRLASRKVGGRRLTCAAWLDSFVAALNPEPVPSPARRTAARRDRDAAAARSELDRLLST